MMMPASLEILRRAAVVVALLSLAGCGAYSSAGSGPSSRPEVPAPASPAPSTPAPAVAVCLTSQLQITVARSGVAGPAVGGYVGFRNTAAVPCRLSGWPRLVALTAPGSAVRAKHVITTMFGPDSRTAPQVTLAPGALGEAVFTGGESGGSCGSGTLPTYRSLRVTPPGNTRSATVSAWLEAVGTYLPACGPISETPVVPSASLYPMGSS
jgi:hypothetical protein